MDQTLLRVAAKEREEITGSTKQKMARRLNKEGGNHLEQESNRQKTMEGIDGGLHPAVDGQSLGEGEGEDGIHEFSKSACSTPNVREFLSTPLIP